MKDRVCEIYQRYQNCMKQYELKAEEDLAKEKADILERRFLVMIVGEAKSGKSSFIDAYFETKVLPVDVKQCTNALIHIRHGERLALHAEEEGKTKDLYTEEDIQAFLEEEAKYSVSGKRENLELTLDYPLAEDFQDLQFIDSPGVNAEGGLGEISEKYLPKANAIIFVKSLYGQALESTSFIDFFRERTKRRHKESRYLLLTGSSLFSKKDRESLEADAKKCYGDFIAEDKMFCIDSKLKLFWNDCKSLSEEEIAKKVEEEEFDTATVLWYQAKGEKEAFLDLLWKKSNFGSLEESLQKFANDFEQILCLQFLENMAGAYMDQLRIFAEQRKLLEDNRKDPEQIDQVVRDKQEEIKVLSKRLEEGVQEIYDKYIEDDFLSERLAEEYASWDEELGRMKTRVSWTELERWFDDKMKKSAQLSLEISQELIAECDEKLFHDGRKVYLEIFQPKRMDYDMEEAKKQKIDFFQISEMVEALKKHLKANIRKNLESCLYKYTGKIKGNCNRLQYACEELLAEKWNSARLQEKIEEIDGKILVLEKQREEILWELKSSKI